MNTHTQTNRSEQNSKRLCWTVKKLVSDQAGFTIVELMVVLAISAGLMLTAFSMISGRIELVRFTDSTRTLESQLRRHMSNVGTGLNLRGSTDCGEAGGVLSFSGSGPTIGKNRNCVANGIILSFSPSDSYRVQALASLNDVDDDAGSLDDIKTKLGARLTARVPGTNQQVSYNWQARYTGGFAIEGGAVHSHPSVEFLRIRAVNSSTEYVFFGHSTVSDLSSGFRVIEGDNRYGVCLEGEKGHKAALVVGSEGLFEAVFEPDSAWCP